MAQTLYHLKALPQFLGKKFGKDFKAVQNYLDNGDQPTVTPIAEALLAGQNATFELDGQTFEVTPEEVQVDVENVAAEGYTVFGERGYLAALDTRLTEDLLLEGLSREIVRRIQSLRKDADFNVDDTIEVVYETETDQLTKAIQQFAEYIKQETLAASMEQMNGADGYTVARYDDERDVKNLGGSLTLGVKRV
jgi:isoleucyl-tRNA synthetase